MSIRHHKSWAESYKVYINIFPFSGTNIYRSSCFGCSAYNLTIIKIIFSSLHTERETERQKHNFVPQIGGSNDKVSKSVVKRTPNIMWIPNVALLHDVQILGDNNYAKNTLVTSWTHKLSTKTNHNWWNNGQIFPSDSNSLVLIREWHSPFQVKQVYQLRAVDIEYDLYWQVCHKDMSKMSRKVETKISITDGYFKASIHNFLYSIHTFLGQCTILVLITISTHQIKFFIHQKLYSS